MVIRNQETTHPAEYLKNDWSIQTWAPPLAKRHPGAGTPLSREDVVVVHAAVITLCYRPQRLTRTSSPRMELNSDRAGATLAMSQIERKDDESSSNVDYEYESLPIHVSMVTHMTAGAVAGVLEHTVMYPVDSVKVSYTQSL